jgi:hypothetical protein
MLLCFRFAIFLLKHVFLCCFCFACTRRRWRERRLPQHVVAADGGRRGSRVPRGADSHLQHLPDAADPAPGLADGAAAGADHLLPSHRPRLHGAAQLRTVHSLSRYVSKFSDAPHSDYNGEGILFQMHVSVWYVLIIDETYYINMCLRVH